MIEASETGGTSGTSRTPIHSDKCKRAKKKQRRTVIINNVTRLLDNILLKPEIWVGSDLKLISERYDQITSNPVKYPPPLQICGEGKKFVVVLLPYLNFWIPDIYSQWIFCK